MGSCDMCGADTFLFLTMVEGTQLKVCKNCAKYGKIVGRVKSPIEQKKIEKRRAVRQPELLQMIVEDYPKIIKKSREAMGLKQEELAQKIAEKESLIHHMENGQFKPSLGLARKLERFLRTKLIEQYEEKSGPTAKQSSGPITIGDLIKIKKR